MLTFTGLPHQVDEAKWKYESGELLTAEVTAAVGFPLPPHPVRPTTTKTARNPLLITFPVFRAGRLPV
jgi:hypothetical protein